MINSVELVNWKTHGSTTLLFSKGTNILIGQMGSGKSSVMDAISFGLFGAFPAIKNRRTSVEGLIRSRPSQMKRARVRISFSSGEDSYVVEREIALGEGARASLQKNGAYVQSQPQKVTEEIERILHMDYDLFSRAVYSEQNRLDYFLELRASERKKQIDGLLGLDRFASAQENATSLMNRVKEMLEQGRKTAEGFDLTRHKEEMNALLDEQKGMEKEGMEMGLEIGLRRKERAGMDAELRLMHERYALKIATAKEIAELKSRIAIVGREIERIDAQMLGGLAEISAALKTATARQEEIRDRLKAAMAAMQDAQTRIGKAQGEMISIAKEAEERIRISDSIKGSDRKKLAEEFARSKEDLDRIESEIASSRALRAEASRWAAELEKHLGRCPVCEREMDGKMKEELLAAKRRIIADAEGRLARLLESQKKERGNADLLNASLNRLTVAEERLKGFEGLEKRKEEAGKRLDGARLAGAASKKLADEAAEEAAGAAEDVSRFKSSKATLERRESYGVEKKNAEELAARKELELGRIEVDEKMLEEAQRKFTALSTELGAMEARLEEMEKALAGKRKEVEAKRKGIEAVERIYEEMRAKKAVLENLAKFNSSLQETQAQLRARLVDSVNGVMREIWPELYPYEDYTGLELGATEDDYVLRVCAARDGKEAWEEVDAIASGGERSTACLVMRVAFALVLVPNLRWLILDEPTHNIDQRGIGRFIEVFNEKLPGIIGQIFIITHDEQLRQVSNAKVYMLSRDKAKGEETAVERV